MDTERTKSRALFDELLRGAAKGYPPPRLPGPGEAAVVALHQPKTAALCFDRVWGIRGVPDEIAFHGDTVWEYAYFMFRKLLDFKENDPARWARIEGCFGSHDPNPFDMVLTIVAEPMGGLENLPDLNSTRKLTEYLAHQLGREVVPYYPSQESGYSDYPAGPSAALAAALTGLEIVDEEGLEWEQVVQFRRDLDARRKYQRMVHWLRSIMKGQDTQWVLNEIGIRLEAYRDALRKHGLRTKLGILSCIVQAETQISALATAVIALLAGAPAWVAVLPPAAIVTGKIAIEIVQKKLDLSDVQTRYGEIAFIHEAAQLSSAKQDTVDA